MKKQYVSPAIEIVAFAAQPFAIIDPSVGPWGDAKGGQFIDEADEEQKPIFDKWDNPLWEE